MSIFTQPALASSRRVFMTGLAATGAMAGAGPATTNDAQAQAVACSTTTSPRRHILGR